MAESLSLAAPVPTRGPNFGHDVAGHNFNGLANVELAVEGMHCGVCMRKIEDALQGMPGVAAARCNLSTRRVNVTTRSARADVEPLIDGLAAIGFKATVLDQKATVADTDADTVLLRRLGVAGFAAANIMLLSVSVWSGRGGDMPASLQLLFHWLSAIIALPAIAYAGQPFFISARRALAARSINMDVPISLGVILATAMSLYQTWRHSEQVYFDAAVTLLFFLLIGRVLDQRVRRRAMGAAENLLAIKSPMTSVVRNDGSVSRVETVSVEPGTEVLIAAGERISLDAKLVRGDGVIDESLITGESHPKNVHPGDQLYAGTIALTGPLFATTTANAQNTLLADIARLMSSAVQERGRYVRLADRAAQLYAPMVHILGATTFIGWMLAGQAWDAALTSAVAVLIITCPCALALAVPAVQVVACGRLFRAGIIVKASDGLERLAEIDGVVLDKTGTLTLGEPRLVDDAPVSPATLQQAACLAVQSRHPYARAIVRAASERALTVVPLADVVEVAGKGLRAIDDGVEIRLGSRTFCGGSDGVENAASLTFRRGDEPLQSFKFEDHLRPDASAVVAALKSRGLSVEILSGDTAAAVADVAAITHIDDWRAAQRPDQKIARLAELKSRGRRVMMVGDGLNDAPALASAHVSLSPSTAAEISQTAADVIFQGERLQPILTALEVAKMARRRAIENFVIAIGYNVVFVPLAMAGRVTPLVAAIAMSASSIAVTLNALRLGLQKGNAP